MREGWFYSEQREGWFYSELAEFNHNKQVKEFGFCFCEEQEYFPYSDCPKETVG